MTASQAYAPGALQNAPRDLARRIPSLMHAWHVRASIFQYGTADYAARMMWEEVAAGAMVRGAIDRGRWVRQQYGQCA